MTSLDPSHNIFRKSSGRHAQAVYNAQDAPSTAEDDLSDDEMGVDDHVRAQRRGKKEGRKRVRQAMPPLPDQRFEQSYLLSIRPFLTPKATAAPREGDVEEEQQTRSKIVSAEDDAVYHWGRDLEVDWKMVTYVTLRDQLFWPMISGALWGWGSLFLASTSSALRGALYPPSHARKGRITGGPGGKISQAGGGEAVGGSWWNKFVKSWGGAVQTASV